LQRFRARGELNKGAIMADMAYIIGDIFVRRRDPPSDNQTTNREIK
jgi:hypothetical protein